MRGDQRARAVDRPFDYAIPKELSEKVSAGSRVIVPFSRGNRETEGFVLRTKERADALGQVKAMIGLSGDEPAFPESMVPLIEYLHKRCLAPYLDIIHAAIPAGSAVKTVMHITLLDKAKLTGRDVYKRQILQRCFQENRAGDSLSPNRCGVRARCFSTHTWSGLWMSCSRVTLWPRR